MTDDLDAITDADDLRTMVRELRHLVEVTGAQRDHAMQDRRDALSVKTAEGLTSSEWILRTGKAERERDEMRQRAEAAEIALQRAEGALADAGDVPTRPVEDGVHALREAREHHRQRARRACQTLAEEVGALGPCSVEDAADRAVHEILLGRPSEAAAQRDRLAALLREAVEFVGREATDWRISQSMRERIRAALAELDAPQGEAEQSGLAKAAWRLSTWAASVDWHGGPNTEEWLGVLRDRIAAVQRLCSGPGMRTEGPAWIAEGDAPQGEEVDRAE